MIVPYMYLLGAAIGVGIMANLRKYYQSVAGSDLIATLLFSALSAFTAFLISLMCNGLFRFEPLMAILSAGYAMLSTVTTILCIVAAKYGSASSVILYGLMGTLVLPCCFGLLFDPEDLLNTAKIFGFLFAAAALLVGFHKQKNSLSATSKMKHLQLAIFFSNGMALVVFKLASMLRPGFHQGHFITEYMLMSAVASAIILVIILGTTKRHPAKNMLTNVRAPAAVFSALAYAVAYFISDSFSIRCTVLIPLTIQAPLSFCLPILCTAILEYVIYKHTLHKYDYLQILFASLCSVCFVFG